MRLSAAKAYAFFLDAQEPFSFAKKKAAALDHRPTVLIPEK